MADKTLNSDHLVLIDNWPGAPAHNLSVPTDGFTGAAHHNVSTAAYKLGTKIQVYNAGTAGIPGFATFIYLLTELTSAPTAAAGQVFVVDANTSLYTVTNDPEGELSIPALPSAVCLSVVTDAKYAWFWCGGVCPVDFVAALDGATKFKTNSSVALGSVIIASDLTADEIGFAISAGGATDLPAGYVLASDAA